MTQLVTILIIVLLFLGLELVKGKSYSKVISVLLLLIFETFHKTSNSIPCWDGTSSWGILDATQAAF